MPSTMKGILKAARLPMNLPQVRLNLLRIFEFNDHFSKFYKVTTIDPPSIAYDLLRPLGRDS